jgi:hypothetical protein
VISCAASIATRIEDGIVPRRAAGLPAPFERISPRSIGGADAPASRGAIIRIATRAITSSLHSL